MRNPPTIHETCIRETLNKYYPVLVTSLEFIPTQWIAYCFSVHCTDGARYFLKLHKEDAPKPYAPSSKDFYLPLTYQLHEKGILSYIPHPIRAIQDHLQIRSGGFEFVLYNYIAGKVVGHQGITHDILSRLSQLVGILHRSTSQIKVAHPLTDQYEIPFERELRDIYHRLHLSSKFDTPGKASLAQALLPRWDTMLGYLEHLRTLQFYVRASRKAQVICHTDLHGENLVLDKENHLYIIDWENAIIAPPEHDLFFFAGEAGFWEIFMPGYESQAGAADLDPSILAFYYYRRGLEGILDWLQRICNGTGGLERDRMDLEDTIDCLDGMAFIEPTITRIQTHLNLIHGKARS
jgi:spectinomycin phosphotransferase